MKNPGIKTNNHLGVPQFGTPFYMPKTKERRTHVKKRKLQILLPSLFMILCLSMVLLRSVEEFYHAATSYTNAKEFYESTGLNGKPYHAEMINGTIYYATSAKLASSSTNLKYHTVGFDITLSGNEHSVSFTVQRTGGSMEEIDNQKDSTHEYILYAIKDETLFELAYKSDSQEADYVLESSNIDVKMDAILVTKQEDDLNGTITEDGSGGFTQDGTIFRLKNTSDLNALKDIFTGHKFESYTNILERLPNHLLQIRYNVEGLNASSSTSATAGNGYTIKDDYLSKNGSTFIQNQRLLQQTTLLDPSDINLQKEGYHLPSKKEWTTKDARIFNPTSTYMPKSIEPLIGSQDKKITLYANWQPNTYSVMYHANGGHGSVTPTDFTFDKENSLRVNTFSKRGYYLEPGAEWNTKPDGTGISYGSEEPVKNLSSHDGSIITLYANWKPITTTLTLDKQGGTGGTDVVYQKFNIGFFENFLCSQPTTKVSVPSKTGHTFSGYFETLLGLGKNVIDKTGSILLTSDHYAENTTVYANYKPNIYQITFDKQGGTLGTDTASVTFGDYFPKADAPIKNGYTFKGYFSQPNGKGTLYYTKHMASDKQYTTPNNMTLFAHWTDESAPTVTLLTNADTWTNQSITLTAEAIDTGTGLRSVQIYRVAENGTTTLVASNTNCNGTKSKVNLSFVNPTEGIIRYKAIATDQVGNTAESYNVVYYDVTAPNGEITNSGVNGATLYFELNVTDINPNQ